MPIRIRVLGSAAGGGFPQWNCACDNCTAVRRGDPALEPRTQDSLAVSGDDAFWFLLNASPDVLRQIESTRALQPRSMRRCPIAGVILTNGDIDHVLGLLQMREAHPLAIYATDRVREGLERNVLLETLDRFPGHLVWHRLELDRELRLETPDGRDGSVCVRAFAAPGKPPIHLASSFEPRPEDNVGLVVRGAEGGAAVYLTAARSTDALPPIVSRCDALFFDGTFWSDDELVHLGISKARARDMAHLPIGGDDGSLRTLDATRVKRRIYTHINNTNPILRRRSPERRLVEECGWEVARDGMEVVV